jgi:hypothetical protein
MRAECSPPVTRRDGRSAIGAARPSCALRMPMPAAVAHVRVRTRPSVPGRETQLHMRSRVGTHAGIAMERAARRGAAARGQPLTSGPDRRAGRGSYPTRARATAQGRHRLRPARPALPPPTL